MGVDRHRHDEEETVGSDGHHNTDEYTGSEDNDSPNPERSDSSAEEESISEHDDSQASEKSEGDEDYEIKEDDEDDRAQQSLSNIDFGTLVKAQETLQPPNHNKRKLPSDFDNHNSPNGARPHLKPSDDNKPADPRSTNSFKPPTRPSKHAPTILSSKQQVSRSRAVFEPSALPKPRDPRFDAAVQSSQNQRTAVDKANRNYSFLTTYQASEVLDLKTQIKKTKDPAQADKLKRQVMSIESKLRVAAAKQREDEIQREHRQKERTAIATGQKAKPYHLKESEVRQQAKQQHLDSMGKKARDKAVDRKRKREKTKESKHMPRVRREA